MTQPPPAPPPRPTLGVREETVQAFVFRLGTAVFLCAAESVEAVVQTLAPMPLPRVPPHVRGLVEHDHRALAVVDLARFLGLAPGDAASSRTLVLRSGELHAGVPVQAALGVVVLREQDRKPPSGAFGAKVDGFVRGEWETPHGLGAWLDLARLLEAARV